MVICLDYDFNTMTSFETYVTMGFASQPNPLPIAPMYSIVSVNTTLSPGDGSLKSIAFQYFQTWIRTNNDNILLFQE